MVTTDTAAATRWGDFPAPNEGCILSLSKDVSKEDQDDDISLRSLR